VVGRRSGDMAQVVKHEVQTPVLPNWKKKKKARFTPVIIDTWEGEIGRTDI
jgi:23S rRNA A2030 N6-methylase RlmJ